MQFNRGSFYLHQNESSCLLLILQFKTRIQNSVLIAFFYLRCSVYMLSPDLMHNLNNYQIHSHLRSTYICLLMEAQCHLSHSVQHDLLILDQFYYYAWITRGREWRLPYLQNHVDVSIFQSNQLYLYNYNSLYFNYHALHFYIYFHHLIFLCHP